jgi:hypothetical protein
MSTPAISTREGPVSALERPGVTASGVRPLTFTSSLSDRWAQVGARVCIGLAGGAIVGWGARHGIYGLLVAAGLLVGPVLWVSTRPGWRTAWRVVVSDQYVEATRYGGARTRLVWDGVGEVQHFVRARTRGPIRVLRLLSVDRQRDVIFDDRLPGFEQLMGLVEARIRQVNSRTPSSWGRMLWPKAQVNRDG